MGRNLNPLFICASILVFDIVGVLPKVLLASTASAQESRALYDVKLGKEIEKIGIEISKFKEEVDQLKAQNSPIGRVATYAGVLGGIVGTILTIVISVLGFVIPRRLNAARVEQMRQERELSRERSNLELFRDLASPSGRMQLAAAAVLIQRLFGQTHRVERKTITDVLVAVMKERPRLEAVDKAQDASSKLVKYIADNIVKALDAVVPDGRKPEPRKQSPLVGPDWQEAQLINIWWKGVDARGIDFFQANFEQAGLAGAFLSKATLYEASLRGAVLTGADLREANLQSADLSGASLVGADLTGANLRDAKLDGILFDASTRWPDGFHVPALSAARTA